MLEDNLYKGNPAVGDGESVQSKDIHKAIQSDDELTEKSGRKGKPFSKEEINKALDWLKNEGVRVDNVAGDIVAG